MAERCDGEAEALREQGEDGSKENKLHGQTERADSAAGAGQPLSRWVWLVAKLEPER